MRIKFTVTKVVNDVLWKIAAVEILEQFKHS